MLEILSDAVDHYLSLVLKQVSAPGRPSPLFVKRPDSQFDLSAMGTLDPAFNANPDFQKAANQFPALGVAVVDFTKDANAGRIGGWNIDDEFVVASVAKVAAMYAAYQLRSDLRDLAKDNHIADQADLVAAMLEAWRNAPEKEVQQVAASPLAPQLDRIFDLKNFDATNRAIEFSKKQAYSEDDLNAISFRENDTEWDTLATMGFFDRMHLMIRWSDNYAATSCISELGLPFIEALLRQSGIFDGTRGLWLGSGYEPARAPFRGLGPEIGVNVKVGVGPTTSQGGTARLLAGLLWLLVHKQLVNPEASLQMLALMNKSREKAEGSYFKGVFNRPAPEKLYSKIGVLEKGAFRSYNEMGYVKVAANFYRTLRFILVITNADKRDQVWDLAEAMLAVVDELNPPEAPP